jgi:hypothetical protein
MVNVLPEPVTPKRVIKSSALLIDFVISAIAAGWSPLGLKLETILKSAIMANLHTF